MYCRGCCFNQFQGVSSLCSDCDLCDDCCECPSPPPNKNKKKREQDFEDFIQSVKRTKKILLDECERCQTMIVLEDSEISYNQCEICLRVIACDGKNCDRKCIVFGDEDETIELCRECYNFKIK